MFEAINNTMYSCTNRQTSWRMGMAWGHAHHPHGSHAHGHMVWYRGAVWAVAKAGGAEAESDPSWSGEVTPLPFDEPGAKRWEESRWKESSESDALRAAGRDWAFLHARRVNDL